MLKLLTVQDSWNSRFVKQSPAINLLLPQGTFQGLFNADALSTAGKLSNFVGFCKLVSVSSLKALCCADTKRWRAQRNGSRAITKEIVPITATRASTALFLPYKQQKCQLVHGWESILIAIQGPPNYLRGALTVPFTGLYRVKVYNA